MAKVIIKQVKSGIDRPERQKRTLKALGLRKLNHSVQCLARGFSARKPKPLVDRSFPVECLAEAHAPVDTGRKRGNVVVTVGRS